MPLYTRRGDTGTTSLANGASVSKASERIEACGAVDEANCAVGLALAATDDELLATWLGFLQQRLFNCSASLADPGSIAPGTSRSDVVALERAIDGFETSTGVAHGFVLPRGSESAARLHVARASVRRAERAAVALAVSESIEPTVLSLLNRASDLLFAAARHANTIAGVPEARWDAEAVPPE
jgi:cob(I)alamin adenosyltransferase